MAETVTAGCERQLAQAEPSHAACSAASALCPLALVTSSRSATASCHLASVPPAVLMALSTAHACLQGMLCARRSTEATHRCCQGKEQQPGVRQ